jgi:hypothetical protein
VAEDATVRRPPVEDHHAPLPWEMEGADFPGPLMEPIGNSLVASASVVEPKHAAQMSHDRIAHTVDEHEWKIKVRRETEEEPFEVVQRRPRGSAHTNDSLSAPLSASRQQRSYRQSSATHVESAAAFKPKAVAL